MEKQSVSHILMKAGIRQYVDQGSIVQVNYKELNYLGFEGVENGPSPTGPARGLKVVYSRLVPRSGKVPSHCELSGKDVKQVPTILKAHGFQEGLESKIP